MNYWLEILMYIKFMALELSIMTCAIVVIAISSVRRTRLLEEKRSPRYVIDEKSRKPVPMHAGFVHSTLDPGLTKVTKHYLRDIVNKVKQGEDVFVHTCVCPKCEKQRDLTVTLE